eukprot:366470-Chlamydomonas_euryale.AAC.7
MQCHPGGDVSPACMRTMSSANMTEVQSMQQLGRPCQTHACKALTARMALEQLVFARQPSQQLPIAKHVTHIHRVRTSACA